MANIWCISAPMISHTDWGGFSKTARQLMSLGHSVVWISGEALAGPMTKAGFQFEPVAHTGFLYPLPPPPDFTSMDPQDAVKLRYRRALDTWLSEDLVAAAASDLLALADRIGPPDIILTDPFLSAAALVAEAVGAPMGVMGWPGQSTMTESALLPVQRYLGAESRDRLHRLLRKFSLNGDNFSKGATPSVLSPGLHVSYFTRNWFMQEAATLLPQNVFVGGYPQPPSTPAPDWLQDIPEHMPLALITLGTVFTGDLGFFAWAAQAAARAGTLPVVSIGWNPVSPDAKAELVAALPPGARLLNWVPFEHVLPRSKLMIHHGGMGTTHAGVVYGIPQIVVPHAADQRLQARRVAQAKVGLNLTAHDVRQGMLAEAVTAIQIDHRVRQNALRLADEMAALGGDKSAANAVADRLLA